MLRYVVLVILVVFTNYILTNDVDTFETKEMLSEDTWQVIRHLRDGSKGIPGLDITDPIRIPDFSTNISKDAKGEFSSTAIHGLSSLTLNRIHVDFVQLSAKISINVTRLDVRGNYSLEATAYYVRIAGNGSFSMNISDAFVTCEARLDVTDDGRLKLADVHLDVAVKEMKLHFENLGGFMSRFINNILNAASKVIFKSIKPSMVSELKKTILKKVNPQLDKLPPQKRFLNPLFPIDYVLGEVTEQLKERDFDPLLLPYHKKFFRRKFLLIEWHGSVKLFDGFIEGLSTLHRTSDVNASFYNRSFHATANLGFDQLQGGYKWEIEFMGITHTGGLHIKIDSCNLHLTVSLANDTAHPTVTEFSIQDFTQTSTDVDGLGSTDFLLELLGNSMINLFKKHVSRVIGINIRTAIEENLKKIKLPL